MKKQATPKNEKGLNERFFLPQVFFVSNKDSLTMEEKRKEQEGESPTITISPPEYFKHNSDLFDNEKTFPDLDFIIPELERPLKLHKAILSQTSTLIEGILKAKQDAEGADRNEIRWMFDTSKKVDREALVKVLRFCYGDAVTVGVNDGECCAVIAALYRLQVICTVDTAAQLSKFSVEQAEEDLTVGAELLLATQHYPECTNTNYCALDKQLAEIVLKKEIMQKDYDTVVDRCLMKLPAQYLDIANYGDAHTKWSELTMRARYVRYHSESLNQKDKEELLKKCDWNHLMSGELEKLNEFGVVEKDTILVMYHDTLECTERDQNYWHIRAVSTEREADQRKKEDERKIKQLESTVQAFRALTCLQ